MCLACNQFNPQIITREEEEDDDQLGEETMPLLVYVSREKRRASPHHFKAGALNALVRCHAPT
jgi:hypothetical protein